MVWVPKQLICDIYQDIYQDIRKATPSDQSDALTTSRENSHTDKEAALSLVTRTSPYLLHLVPPPHINPPPAPNCRPTTEVFPPPHINPPPAPNRRPTTEDEVFPGCTTDPICGGILLGSFPRLVRVPEQVAQRGEEWGDGGDGGDGTVQQGAERGGSRRLINKTFLSEYFY